MQLLKERTEEILRDSQSGSGTILEKCIKMLSANLEANPSPDVNAIIKNLRRIYWKHARMAVLFHFCNGLFLEIEEEKLLEDEKNAGEKLLAFLNTYTAQWQHTETGIARELMEEVVLKNKSILLHSNSSSIVKALSALAGKGILPQIYQTVSWPAEEGKVQAAELAKLGFSINVIADTAVQNHISDIDLALFGCDALFPAHFVNKTGTTLYAALLKSWNKKVYILSDSRKLIKTNLLPDSVARLLLEEKPRDPGEIWKNPPEGVSPLNEYFESVPNDYASAFILESGIYKPGKLDPLFKGFRVSELFKFEED